MPALMLLHLFEFLARRSTFSHHCTTHKLMWQTLPPCHCCKPRRSVTWTRQGSAQMPKQDPSLPASSLGTVMIYIGIIIFPLPDLGSLAHILHMYVSPPCTTILFPLLSRVLNRSVDGGKSASIFPYLMPTVFLDSITRSG